MKFCAQLAGLALLIVWGTVPAWAGRGTVTGLVRDSAGVPQIGAQVELLRPDLTVAASAYTNRAGRFVLASILPGHYSVKAMNTSFLPSLRENVHVRGRQTVVNLTLNTLYEVMQWLPAQPRSRTAPNDDWMWTLRSAADRPLLRWLEDGPLVVVTEGNGAAPRLKARLMATGQAGTFGESGERFTATVEDTPQSSRALLARVDFAAGTDANMESMLGFRQDLGYAGSVQSVAAVAIHPEVVGGNGAGLNEAGLRSMETLRLGDTVDAEVGSTLALARNSDAVETQNLPYLNIAFHEGDSVIRYRMATMVAEPGEATSDAAMPRISGRGGAPVFEHGMHQEIGWERLTGSSAVALLVFADRVQNPVLEASAHLAEAGGAAGLGALYDPQSGLVRAAGPEYSSVGVQASAQHNLPGQTELQVSYSNGNALVMPALRESPYRNVQEAARPRRIEAYSISLSGTLDGTRTRWRASYRWQPDDTVTPIAPFAMDAAAPYLNLHLCQSVHRSRDGVSGVEALLEVQNLLAQGYRPYLLSDGSILLFAQGQRALRAGLAFTF